MSSHLLWMIVRDNSSFLMKRRHSKTFSKEPNNLRSVNSFRYNGFVQKKTLGVESAPTGKGVVLVTRNAASYRKPLKHFTRLELKNGSRRTMATIKKVIKVGKYRKDLKMAALKRASAIIRSQKPVVVKKARPDKKKD